MRRLYLLRHAKSCWKDPQVPDFDRPLNRRGRQAAALLARALPHLRPPPQVVLCSAARRTVETWTLVAPALEWQTVCLERELYEAGKAALLDRLRRLDDSRDTILLVGHNPGLACLAEGLCAGHGDGEALARLEEKFPTGALAVLETDLGAWADLADDTCRLVSFTRPADLENSMSVS